MTDDSQRPGPWDRPNEPRKDAAKVVQFRRPKPEPAEQRISNPRDAFSLDRGQSPAVMLISTLLLGGLVWYLWQSWQVALALIVGVFVHEYGHVLMMNKVGMGPAKIHIVPFFGGLAKGKRAAKSEWDDILVSLAGPVFGLLAAIPFFVLALAVQDVNWLKAAFAVSLLNLINLLPAPPLDGSRALGPVLAFIHPTLERAAMIIVGVLAVVWGFTSGQIFLPIFLGIALLGYLKRGAWRPIGRKLTGKEAAMSFGLFLLSGALCMTVAIVALTMMTPLGLISDGARIAASMVGIPT